MISKQNLTIVCASHNGENKLPLFLDSIKKNSQKPKEIIICGTNASDINKVSKDTLQSLDIKFVVSDIANQIYQRRLAISMIKTSYILQLDDDLILEENAIKKYCSHFNTLNSANNIVSGYTIFPNGKHMSSRFKS